MTPAQTGWSEKTRRQVIYWAIEDMGIDGTSLMGQYVIENYRPPCETAIEFKEAHDSEAIQRWIDDCYMKEAGA